MNTKNNKRRRASREKLEHVFIELLQTKRIQEISVSDLCKAAGLNRSTFYANYADIFDLADTIRKKLEDEVGKLYEEERLHHYNSNDFLKLFRHIRDNQLFYKTYFKLGYHHDSGTYQYDVHQAERSFENRYIDYHIEFFRNGFNAIVRRWLDGGCRETPEEMEEILKTEYLGRHSSGFN